MPFGTRAELAEVVGSYLNRTNLAPRIPDFIALTEASINRLLRDPQQISPSTAILAFTDGAATLPDDFGQMIAFGPRGDRLQQVTPGEFGTYEAYAGDPLIYSVSGGTLNALPTQSGAVPITYYRGIPPLDSDGASNWLLARAPDVYLYGVLLQAEVFGWNDDRVGLFKSAYDEAVTQLRVDGENRRWGAAPLAPRIRRP